MSNQFFVVSDKNDPGMEFDNYDDARIECVKRQKEGLHKSCILGDTLTWIPSWEWDEKDEELFMDDYYNYNWD